MQTSPVDWLTGAGVGEDRPRRMSDYIEVKLW